MKIYFQPHRGNLIYFHFTCEVSGLRSGQTIYFQLFLGLNIYSQKLPARPHLRIKWSSSEEEKLSLFHFIMEFIAIVTFSIQTRTYTSSL